MCTHRAVERDGCAGKDGERRELEEPGHRKPSSLETLETHTQQILPWQPRPRSDRSLLFPSPPLLCVTLSFRGWITPFRVARCELQNARFAFCASNTVAASPESLKTRDCRREMEVTAITPPSLRPVVVSNPFAFVIVPLSSRILTATYRVARDPRKCIKYIF